MFQSTPPRGGRQRKRHKGVHYDKVSIHAPARGATDESDNPHVDVHVSIHAPARGATDAPRALYRGRRSFNPRPRAGGDPRPGRALRPGHRFNPRPRAGGDTKDVGGSLSAIAFQSTPPRGGRLEKALDIHAAQVSIHAPARGATFRPLLSPCFPVSFNPRPRAGGDKALLGGVSYVLAFQSTPPRGGRQNQWFSRSGASRRFNPRPRAGGDRYVRNGASALVVVSIHAPARGATRVLLQE